MKKRLHNILCIYPVTTFLLIPLYAVAETEKIAPATSLNTFSFMNVLNMGMGLIVVIALILGLAWVLKKYGRLPNNNLVEMKVLGGLSLGTREKAILIEVENTRLLVGVTPGQIQTLHVLGESPAKPATSFNETLTSQIEKANGEG